MKSIAAIVLAVCLCYSLCAQNTESFVIKGTAKNHSQDFWELGVSGFIGSERISIPIDKNNRFFKTVSITHPQDLYLDLTDDGIFLFAVPGDTIDVSWDGKDFNQTFKVTASGPGRQTEINLMLELSRRSRPLVENLMDDLYSKQISDSSKFEKVKAHFANQAQLALSYPLTENSKKILCDLYFQNIQMLNHARLLKKYPLSFYSAVPKTTSEKLFVLPLDSKIIDESLYYVSDTYRGHIFDAVRFNDAFTAWVNVGSSSPGEKYNYTLKDCFSGGASLYMTPTILDWYLTKAIIFGFERYSFEGSEEAYQIFSPRIKTQVFRDTLEHFYKSIQRLKPGKEAPVFSLQNEKGKMVSLSDFKGKVVYIDFWSKYCGPCLYDIKNDVPKLHERYKNNDVAFLNISLDVDEKEWKETLAKLKLDGINLLIEGSNHPVCTDYNVNAVPHYILIDKKGNIVQNNAERPGELLEKEKNIIDKLLE